MSLSEVSHENHHALHRRTIKVSVNAIRKKSHGKEMNTSKDLQNRLAGPYAPTEISKVKKFAKVLTTMLAGSNEARYLYCARVIL